MNINEYFKDWIKVIDKDSLVQALRQVSKEPSICPLLSNIFKAFELCPYKECRIVMLFQDPYPQKGIATGIALGNNTENETELSPSLKIVKECVINLAIPHNIINFDNSLEDWCKQGMLMLNSALTCKMNNIGSHANIWRPFTSKLLYNLSRKERGIVYALFGKQAQTFIPYIEDEHNLILKCEHPSYFARNNIEMPRTIFNEIDKYLKDNYNEKINWYYEEN